MEPRLLTGRALNDAYVKKNFRPVKKHAHFISPLSRFSREVIFSFVL